MADNRSTGIKGFFERKNLNISPKLYFVDAMGAMAFGLFASLLIGTIFNTLSNWTDIEFFSTMSVFAKAATGAAIGIAVAHTLKAPPLVLYTCAAVGLAGYCYGAGITDVASIASGSGNPLGAYVAVLVACELGKVVSKETRLDIILTPIVTLAAGTGIAIWLAPWLGKLMNSIGALITDAMAKEPLLMSIAVSVIVGILLTLPISSAAICAAIGISGLAGGAAAAGCCAQMVGFAVMSFRENRWGGLVAQGLGTSMLQMPNIIKNPRIWIPPTLASAITGPLATCLFKLEMNGAAVSSGMGTCGLVGQIGVYTGWVNSGKVITAFDWIGLVLICFVLPAILTWVFSLVLRKWGWIKENDLKLDL